MGLLLRAVSLLQACFLAVQDPLKFLNLGLVDRNAILDRPISCLVHRYCHNFLCSFLKKGRRKKTKKRIRKEQRKEAKTKEKHRNSNINSREKTCNKKKKKDNE